MTDTPLKKQLESDGRVLRLTLARPKANIVDAEMLLAIKSALTEHRDDQNLVAVLIAAEGPHFSFGASVEEHLPGQCAEMLKTIDGLVLDMIAYPVPILVAVRGQCLGGGLEVACAGSMIFAAPDSYFGQPEIQLAVFAPIASCLLPEMIGQTNAEDLLFSGRSIDSKEAQQMGLINRIDTEPEQAAMEYIETQLIPRSTFAMRHAVWAARYDFIERINNKLAKVEDYYINGLMSGNDPAEGLTAFIEKRKPHWENR
jgi:cyclohexa-1,5-dienecarbonyl-CoA hydratase